MAWIESHQKLEKSGKLLRLAELLNINRYQAIGHLHAFWWWALDNAEDGDVTRFSSVTVAQVCGWSDYLRDEIDLSRINESTNKDLSEKAFFGACIEAGLLDKVRDRVTIHNWNEYTHHYFAIVEKTRRNREQTKARVKQFRERNVDVRSNGNANVTHHGNGAVTPSNAPTRPDLTRPDLTSKKKKSNVVAQAPQPKFVKPTAMEVKAYALSIGFRLDGERFIAHYQSNGWKVGRNPMKDWRAAVVTWKKGADPAALIPLPRPPEQLPNPEDRVSHEQVKGLLATIGKGMPR